MSIYTFLYNIVFIPFAKIFVFTAKFFNKKIQERENNSKRTLDSLSRIDHSKPVLLIHSSSMGEFEQAKPIIERLKNEADISIICSFYSPSGYLNQQNYKYADAIVYLPFDSKSNASKFIQRVNPDLVIFIRYDIWHNHLIEISKRECQLWLIDATEPQSKVIKSLFFWSFTKYNYNLFDKIYTLTEKDYTFFNSLSLDSKIIKSTDTRFDRIIEKVENAKANQIISRDLFDDDCFILVAGSTWGPDEDLISNTVNKIDSINKKIFVIFVPHEPTEENISKLSKRFTEYTLYSEIKNAKSQNVKITNNIIVDEIGILLQLYAIADAAFIGGGFGTGVHSVTEPAGYSIPIACGSKMNNSPDAVNLQNKGALEVVHNEKEMYNWLRSIILYNEQRAKYGEIAGTYVYKSKGSSHVISKHIIEYLYQK